MGGSHDPTLNSPANIVAVCGHGTAGCHGRVETSRTIATHYGWLIARGQDQETTPILYRGIWSHITSVGTVEHLPSLEQMRLPDPRPWMTQMKVTQKQTHR